MEDTCKRFVRSLKSQLRYHQSLSERLRKENTRLLQLHGRMELKYQNLENENDELLDIVLMTQYIPRDPQRRQKVNDIISKVIERKEKKIEYLDSLSSEIFHE